MYRRVVKVEIDELSDWSDEGGTVGRRYTLYCSDGAVLVRYAGVDQPAVRCACEPPSERSEQDRHCATCHDSGIVS